MVELEVEPLVGVFRGRNRDLGLWVVVVVLVWPLERSLLLEVEGLNRDLERVGFCWLFCLTGRLLLEGRYLLLLRLRLVAVDFAFRLLLDPELLE